MEYKQWATAEKGIYYTGLKQSGHKFAVAPLSLKMGVLSSAIPSSHHVAQWWDVVKLLPTDHLQALGLSVGNELLADHFNKIQS